MPSDSIGIKSLRERRACRQCIYNSFMNKFKDMEAMSDYYVDEYEHFNYDYDKHIFTGHSGKQRSKREALTHTNHFDPSGHSRKILTKLMNSEHNKRHDGKAKA